MERTVGTLGATGAVVHGKRDEFWRGGDAPKDEGHIEAVGNNEVVCGEGGREDVEY